MTTLTSHTRVVQEPVDVTIRRLESSIGRMEHRYECTSAAMMKAMKAGKVRETAEISRWMIDYLTLRRLRRAAGATTGSHTSNTR